MSTNVDKIWSKAMTDRTDVLIAGAGPTGMALSIALGQAGVRHMVIDRLSAGLNTSRAAVIHAQTLELLERLGIADRLVELGVKLANFTIRDRDRALVRLRFDNLPTRHPYLLMLPQDITERVLAARMTELGTAVRRGVEATRVVEDVGGVRVIGRSGATRCRSSFPPPGWSSSRRCPTARSGSWRRWTMRRRGRISATSRR
jgi:2-polyprenyl-6-methoxyphenol hydroxylase-like FAD-dependent oxidoreductase